MTFRRSIVFAFVFLVCLLLGTVWKSIQSTNDAPPKPLLETNQVNTGNPNFSIPQLVAKQLKSGDLNCPNLDPLTYEACLLYQGALGIWCAMGFPETCPDVVDDSYEAPFPKEGPAKEGRELLPADVLRAPTVPCFSYLYAIQVANAVPVLVSAPNRGFRKVSGKPFSEPGSDPDSCIAARYGICGNQAALGVALFEVAGFKSRPVEFYYYNNGRRSHIIPEVMIDGDWRPIDTTYGAYWASNVPGKPFTLQTLDDILHKGAAWARQNTKLIHNSALLPYGISSSTSRYNFFSYLNPGASILRGGKGEISLALIDKKGVENFKHRPNYIGDNKPDGESAGVTYKLDATPGKYSIVINISGSAFGEEGPVAICIDKNCTKFSREKKTYRFAVTNPSHLYLKSGIDVSYIVMASIEWERVD